jgi:hypothetical protein
MSVDRGGNDDRAMHTTSPDRSTPIPFVHATVARVQDQMLISRKPVPQALVFGFARVTPSGDALVRRCARRRPPSPLEWGAIELRLRFRGSPFRLRIDRSGVELDAPTELALRRRDSFWEVGFR